MKKLILIAFLSVFAALSANAMNPRIITTINDSWKFSRGDFHQVSNLNFDDSNWERVTIPHTWNKEDAADDTPGYYRGIGWYRRSLFLPEEFKDKQLFLNFDGVNQETELFVNGRSAGTHVGGYTRFCFDITALLKVGQSNAIAVKVNNRYNENVPPLTADFTFFGGIYRDVTLITTEKQHISTTFHASSGVLISTPSVSEKEAKVTIKTLMANDAEMVAKLRIENSIFSPEGERVSQNSSVVTLQPASTQWIEQKGIPVIQPLLWSPDAPSLYRVHTKVYDAKTNMLLDEVMNPLGLRWYEFNAEVGFILNGKPMKLIGTNRHQCFFNMGNALSDEIHVRDMKQLKSMGANFLRVSHYPQDHVLMEMCDKLGIICSVEIPIVNAITEKDSFTNTCLNMAREMVLQDFNRPSVMIWAYMNEVLLRSPFKDDSIRNVQYSKSVGVLASKIEKLIREVDPERYTLIPSHGNLEAYLAAGLGSVPKIIGFNVYQGWYSGSFDGCDKFLDSAHKKVPGIPFFVTEYGADVDPRLHSFEPQRFDYTQEYANLYHEHYFKTIMDRPYVVGASIWNLNDFYSEERGNAVPHVNNKGIVGLNREVKDTYLYYQALLLKTPFLSFAGTNWKIRGGNEDKNGVCFQPIKVYSNQKSVELFLNGASVGSKAVVDHFAEFNVPFLNGLNTLDVVATTETGIIRDQLKIDFHAVPSNLKTFSEINVLLGSKRYFEDKTASVIWLPEKEYAPGSWGYVGGLAYSKKTRFGAQPASDLDILGTSNDPVFQTMRLGLDAFKLDVPDGKYTVSLYWAELQSDKEMQGLAYNLGNDALKEVFDKRTFGVDINSINVIKDLDLTKDFGTQRAVVMKFEINATNNEGITVRFKKGVGDPILNAIRVYRNY